MNNMNMQGVINKVMPKVIGTVSMGFDKVIGKLAMDRLQAQRDSKITQNTDITGGKDGSETT